MGTTAALRRGLLRSAKRTADTAGISLLEALSALEAAQLTEVAAGKLLTGTSSLGSSVTFSLPPMSDATAQDIHEGADSLLSLYDTIRADGGATDDNSVLARMLKSIRPVRFYGADFSGVAK